MGYFEIENSVLRFRNHGETLELTPWGQNGLRVRSAVMHEIEDTRYALLEPQETLDIELCADDKQAYIRNGKITATLEVPPGRDVARIVFTNQNGDVLLEEITEGGALALKARQFTALGGGDHSISVSFRGSDDERLYGMGQNQLETLNLNHYTLELAQRNSQASIPFVISSRGYGFLWHNPAIGEVNFSKNRIVWKAQSTKQMDYLIFAGDSPQELSLRYAEATGFAPMMPEYGLGFWQSKLRYWNQEQLLAVAREYKRRNLPIDVIVCDFFHWPNMGDFRFDPRFFPDPKAMCSELEALGITLLVSIWPQIALNSENYDEMRQKGLLVRCDQGEQIAMRFGGDSMFYDATNPRARNYVWNKVKKNYYDMGVRAFWLDEAEPEYYSYDYANYRYYAGTHLQIGNLYPQQFSRNFYEGMVEQGQQNPVNLVRCAWAGSQRYGALLWSGDVKSSWDSFRKQVCAGLSAGLSGIPWWTSDIGGFYDGAAQDPDFRELLIRWFQWAAFCPVMRLHGDRRPFADVTAENGELREHTGADNEVWSFGDDVFAILSKYLGVRESMRGYIRELMRAAHTLGKPVIRPMFYEYPNDCVCNELWDQYLFGSDYLVAPVLYPNRYERSVYLPFGLWENADTKEVLSGGRRCTVPAPIDIIPVFRKVPAI